MEGEVVISALKYVPKLIKLNLSKNIYLYLL